MIHAPCHEKDISAKGASSEADGVIPEVLFATRTWALEVVLLSVMLTVNLEHAYIQHQ